MVNNFEQKYKEALQSDIQELTPCKVIISNDITLKPFNKDPSAIIGIIKSGGGVRSYVPDYDYTESTLSVVFLLDTNYTQDFIALLNAYISLNNGVNKQLSITALNASNIEESKTIDYRCIFTTPGLYGEPTDIRVNNSKDSLKISQISLIINLRYSTGIVVTPLVFKLKINNTTYPITCVYSYDFTSTNAYEPVKLISTSKYPTQYKQFETRVINIKLWKSSTDLCTILSQYAIGLQDYVLPELYVSDTQISIQDLSITEYYENGACALSLTFIR